MEESTILKSVEISIAICKLRSDGIVHVTFKTGSKLDVPQQHELLKAYIELVGTNKHPFLFDAGEQVTITKEARDHAITMEDQSPTKASAVVVQNLAYKIIADFYYKFNKPKQPYKVFSNREKAILWLLSMK